MTKIGTSRDVCRMAIRNDANSVSSHERLGVAFDAPWGYTLWDGDVCVGMGVHANWTWEDAARAGDRAITEMAGR